MNKVTYYMVGLFVAIIIAGYFSLYDGCLDMVRVVFTTDTSELCSLYIDLKQFILLLPWILLGVYIPITAVIFYLSGVRKKNTIQIKPREVENETK